MLFPWWIKYPNCNNEILNLDWLEYTVKHLAEEVKNFINLNTIKYADPILWDITRQYEANTIVVDPQSGDAYISTRPVPAGVQLNRTEYWTMIYNYADALSDLRSQIAYDEGNTTTASTSYAVDDLVFVNELLYRVIAPMIAGDSFVVDSNVVKTTIEVELARLRLGISSLDGQIDAIEDTVNTILENDSMYSVKAAGAIGDGVADDTAAFEEWLSYIVSNNKIGYIPNGVYRISHELDISSTLRIVGESDNAILLFENSNGLHIVNTMDNWGCVLDSFSIQTKDTQYVGLIVEGNYHKITNVTLTGYNVKAGNSSYYWNWAIELKGAWYTYIKGVRTMGGAIHTTLQSNIHGNGIHATSQTVNVNIESSTILYHEYGIKIESGCEAVRVMNNIILGNNKGIADGGYSDNIVNNIIDMGVDYGVSSSGNGVIISDNFIAQHYYAPYSQNPDYFAIQTNGIGATIKNNYLPTTSQPNNGIIASGIETVIDGNYISWFKTSIYIIGDKTICVNNRCVSASSYDIAFNASFCHIVNNVLSNDRLAKLGGSNNITQHDYLNYEISVDLDDTAYSQNIDITLPSGYFFDMPSVVLTQLEWSGFDVYYSPSDSSATNIRLVATNRGQLLPNISTKIIVYIKE